MELLLECIMMKNFSDNSIKSIRIPEDSYSIGILLSSPINYTSIPLLEVLLNISSCNDLPDYIQLGALTKFFRHITEIHTVISLQNSQNVIFTLLERSAHITGLLIEKKNYLSLFQYFLKCFNKAVSRLCFEYRTKVEVVKVPLAFYSFIKIVDNPCDIFFLPLETLKTIENWTFSNFPSLVLVTNKVWSLIEERNSKDFDPVKNIAYLLVQELFKKIENDEQMFFSVKKILTDHSKSFTHQQKLKIFSFYEEFCKKFGIRLDGTIKNLLQNDKKPAENSISAWDLIEDEKDFLMSQQSEEFFPVEVKLEKYLLKLKSEIVSNYLKKYVVSAEIDRIYSGKTENIPKIYEKIVEMLKKDDSTGRKFWNFIFSCIRGFRWITNEQYKTICYWVDVINGKIVLNVKDSEKNRENSYKEEKKLEANIQTKEKPIPKALNKHYENKQELSNFIRKTVDDNVGTESFYLSLQETINDVEKRLKSHFFDSEVLMIGSISYKLFVAGTAIDILINSPSYSDKADFQMALTQFFSEEADYSNCPVYIDLKLPYKIRLFFGTKIPVYTTQLVQAYNQSLTVNTFLIYIKIWSKNLEIMDSGYFWTLLGIFYLCNAKELKNLQREVHAPEPVEGFDVWIDCENSSTKETPFEDLFCQFIVFLFDNLGNVFNTKTGEIAQDSDFALGVSDFFTDKIIGIPDKKYKDLEQKIKEIYEEIVSIKT